MNPRSRTLRAEIDLPNPAAKLLPGMYAYGKVHIARTKVLVLPVRAVPEIGNQTLCYVVENGLARRVPVQTGLSDGTWVEVLKKQVDARWVDFTGIEEVITSDLSELTDGQAVNVARGE